MKKFFSLTLHSFRESIHSKALVFVFVYLGFMLLSYSFLEGVDSTDRVKTLQSVSFLVVSLFGTLLAVVLPVLSLNEEIETKKVYNILTKPVSRFTFLAGKATGILLFIFLFTGILSLLSFLFIILTARNSEGVLRAEKPLQAQTAHFLRGDGSTVPLLKWERFNSGSPFSSVRWGFSGISFGDLDGGKGRVRINLESRGAGVVAAIGYTKVYMTVRNPSTDRVFRLSNRPVEDENPFIILSGNTALDLEFPAEAVADDGRILIDLYRPGSKYRAAVEPGSVRILKKPGAYWINYLKTILLICVKFTFIATVSVCAGSFFSLSSGICFSLFVVMMSYMLHFLNANAAPGEEQFYGGLLFIYKVIAPDLTLYNRTLDLIEGISVSWSYIGYAAALTIPLYCVAYLSVAWFGLRDREF